MSLRRIAVWSLAAALLGGCAPLRAARPDAESGAARSWRIRCHWVVEEGIRDGKLEAPRTGTAWATDAQGRDLLVSGALEDGFLRVDEIRAGAGGIPSPSSKQDVAWACQATVRHGEEKARTYAVAAVDEGNAEVPLAFASRPGGDLITRLVVFGDSLSDTGALKRRLEVFPNSPYWLGRFTNGPNWADWLGRLTNLTILNLSVGGALAEPHDDVPTTSVIASIEQGGQHFVSGSVNDQVDGYIARSLLGGRVSRPESTMYLLWEGANDYLAKEPFAGDIGTLLDTPKGEAGYERVVDDTVAAIVAQVRRLHAAGARRFVVVNLPDMGRMPLVLHNTSYRPAGIGSEDERRARLSRRLSQVTKSHNAKLARSLNVLVRELPQTTISQVDADDFLHRALESRDYGFDLSPLERFLGEPPLRLQDRCYVGGYLGTDDPKTICPQVSRALFWDLVHPTSFFHCWIAWLFEHEFTRSGFLRKEVKIRQRRPVCEAGFWNAP